MRKNYFKKGMSLVEMLIAIAIFMLILVGSTYLIAQIYKNYGFAMEEGISVAQVQNSLKRLVVEIRGTRQADSGAYPIVSADKFDFVFYSDVDNDNVTERVHYYLQNKLIRRGITKPSGIPPAYPSQDQTTTTIAASVVNTTSQPLFYFYNINYPADQTSNPLAVPVSQVNQIRLVKMDVYYNLDPYREPNNIRLESYVELRNLKDNW